MSAATADTASVPRKAKRATRALMCPSCGSIDLSIVRVEHAPRIVMRATEPAKAGDWWRKSGTGAS